MTGIVSWIITDFYGGMFIYLLSYKLIILPVILIYIFSLTQTVISMCKTGFKYNKIKIVSHSTVILAVISLNLFHSEIFKSKKILKASLIDDLFIYTLIFRKNGSVENQIEGAFGYSEEIKGKYLIKNDTIIFTKKPYDNDWLPDTLLLDKNVNAIFLHRDKSTGQFITEKRWLNYFEIKDDAK
ncbi:MAG: hypothetical protein LBV26_07855 [Bacteroidales bacterium]|nr:hypothetical protein [Bacteroidales bacterium]